MRFLTGLPNQPDIKTLTKKLGTVLESGVLTNNGPRVQELEEKVSEILEVPTLALANATLGLQFLAKRMNTSRCQSFSFIATGSCMEDIPGNYLEVDSSYQPYVTRSIENAVFTNLFGGCGDLDYYEANSTNCFYDNAHALGVKYNGRPVSNSKLSGVISLHSTKFINGIEGGLITCPNKELYNAIKKYRNFGYAETSDNKFAGVTDGFGINAKLSELHATVALHNLKYLGFLIEVNRERYEWYAKYLPEQCDLIKFAPSVSPNYSYIIIRVKKEVRNALCEFLYKEGIYVKQYFTPIHTIYDSKQSMPFTKRLAAETIALPQGLQLKTENDVLFICTKIMDFFKQN